MKNNLINSLTMGEQKGRRHHHSDSRQRAAAKGKTKKMERVKQFYNKNQFIIEGENGVTFQSYDSTIANINQQGELTLYTDWDYSHTTLKHLYLFLCNYRLRIENDTIRDIIYNLGNSKNKKATLQQAINNNIINYKEI